ncbi:MAG: transcription elongation factor GreAB [Sphingobacteriales bacterium]|nr:MAG: transcription elongation factor GreAB [Sphingobacteriales bacterium]
MKTQELNPVVITEDDYKLLKPYIDRMPGKHEEMTLAYELNRAVVVKKEAFPPHGVRINSKVSVLDLETDKILEFTLVMPPHADMRQNKVSILTPMGAALIGFRKAEEVRWKVPGGLKRFRILDVQNNSQENTIA